MKWAWALAAVATAAGVSLASCGVDALELAGHRCPCVDGFVCDPAGNVCVEPSRLASAPCLGEGCACATAAECRDSAFPKCVDSRCVECTADADTCAAGRYCLASHVCAPGCKSNDECAMLSPTAPFCNVARHQCVNCLGDGDCKNSQKCSPAGACVEACTDGMCPAGKDCCNGLCIDTKTDPLNCNGCGAACAGSATQCCGGVCTDPLTSESNCGQCGVVCSTTNGTPSCRAGSCRWECAPGFSHCAQGNTGCETNTSSDTERCGGCRKSCTTSVVNATGIACVASTCTYATCTSGFMDCDTVKANGCECTGPGTCGAKGQVCCYGNVCYGEGECEPLPGGDGKCH